MGEYCMRHLLKQGFGDALSAQFWLPFRQFASWKLEKQKKTKATTPCHSMAQDLGTSDSVLGCVVCSEHGVN